MLSQLLYNQPELRPPVLKALKVIVESNTKEASEDEEMEDILTKEEIQQNKLYLQTQAESWFGVLFNLFTAVGRDGQGAVGDVISAWASVSSEKVCHCRLLDLLCILNKLSGDDWDMSESR